MSGMRSSGFSTVLLAGLVLTGCDAYERTNPLDPAYPMMVTIVGPDSIFSVNDTVQFQIVTEPAHSDLPFVWSTSDMGRLPPIADVPGRFTSMGNGVAVVRAELGSRRVEKEVVISQRAVRLLIAPPPTTQLASFGEAVQLSAAIVDAKDTPVQGAAADLQWSASDSSVIDLANGRVTARNNGSSWVRARSLGQADSLLISVQQIPATLQFGSANYSIPLPGASVQTVITARDARGNAIASPAGLNLTSSRASFQVNQTGLVQSTGFGSTRITAQLGALEASTNVRVVGGTAPVVNGVAAGLTGQPGSPQNFLVIELDARDAELDLDEATIEVYSTAGTWMTTRVVPLEQGHADYLAVLPIQGAAGAGTLRIRLRDAALNNSSLTTWPVAVQPRDGSPGLEIVQVTIQPNGTAQVVVDLDDGNAALRNVHLFGFAGTGEVVLHRVWAQSTPGVRVLEASLPAGGSIVSLGVVVSDTAGNMSFLRSWDLVGGAP
jgi:hypothetical protein